MNWNLSKAEPCVWLHADMPPCCSARAPPLASPSPGRPEQRRRCKLVRGRRTGRNWIISLAASTTTTPPGSKYHSQFRTPEWRSPCQDLFNFTTSSTWCSFRRQCYSPRRPPIPGPILSINILTISLRTSFLRRRSPPAPLNTGSSLALSGKPSAMGSLQLHKPASCRDSRPDGFETGRRPQTRRRYLRFELTQQDHGFQSRHRRATQRHSPG
jgi:hypothetical protein